MGSSSQQVHFAIINLKQNLDGPWSVATIYTWLCFIVGEAVKGVEQVRQNSVCVLALPFVAIT